MSLPPDNFGRTVTVVTAGNFDIYTVSSLGDISFPVGTALDTVYNTINSYWPDGYTPPPEPTANQSIQNTGVTIDNANTLTANAFVSTVETGNPPFTVTSVTVVPNLTAQFVETNANLTGPVTSIGNATSINLADDHIYIGNSSNQATAVVVSGDATITNTGTLALSSVNSNVGTFGTGTQVSQFTVNSKGLITSASNVAITGASPSGSFLPSGRIWVGNSSNQATDVIMSGDVTIDNIGSTTLASVNSNIGNYYLSSVTTNSKGLITSVTSGISTLAVYGPSSSVNAPTSSSMYLKNWHTPVCDPLIYSMSSDVISVLISGTYEISYTFQASSNANTGSIIGIIGTYISVNDIQVGTMVENTIYRLNGQTNRVANNNQWIILLNSGDTIKLNYLLTQGTTTSLQALIDQCTLIIKKLV